ncbi:MAG: efflux RND transporter periplasmic adaptor subunit [Sandaracinaceae bacterium]
MSPDPQTTTAVDPEVARELGLDRSGRVRRAVVRALQVLVAVGVVALAAFGIWRWRQAPPTTYRTAAVSRGPVEATVSATGTLQPVRTVSVAPEVSGRIAAVHVDFNDRVEAGQLLVELDPRTLVARRSEARAQLRSARAQARQALATLRQARRTHERMARAAAQRIASVQNEEEARTSVVQGEASLAQARAQVALAEASLESIETDLARTEIRAPIDGVVLRRSCEPGLTVAAQFQPPELFLLAEDLGAMHLYLEVDEADVGQIEVGQTARFRVDAYPDRRFEGRLLEIRNAPETVQGVVSYEAVVGVDNRDGLLRPGMTATADVVTDRRDDVLLLPNEALRFTPPDVEASTLGRQVWRRDGDRLRSIPVETGITDGRVTELTEGELEEDQDLLVDVEREAP